ncbi:hypothetical protein Xen7305DRAFT_00041870 [Xenococcus sp. PCC 7305]|uniref:HAD family hydrolase n=1 Tax=Xenococcus sp. PCC 7305 TaxID=102125 RepID=UPI0002ACFEB2|nr:hypothetical protein [Xenococcus sp. PCC 7305]ELS04453.1 hypothetical protein Xen7305DRAFT_00041870 [Xenococcus sp. PCC 7305]
MLPRLLALDFDGVICDGLREYFVTTQKTYHQIWQEDSVAMTDGFAEVFSQLRPVIETGWEMPVLLRSLVLGITPEDILSQWHLLREQIVTKEDLDKKFLSNALDSTRDNWINNDLDNWLSLHRFYPGILSKLQYIINSDCHFYIVTTKEGRFVKRLLGQQGITLPADNIIGKECKRPKYETLRLLRDKIAESDLSIWFIEDRLKTLELVRQQSDLSKVQLFLADWGYNTAPERERAQQHPEIKLISLAEFTKTY